MPPDADTFRSAEVLEGAKTITPSRFHVPPRLSGASHNVIGGPPDTSIFLSFPPAKNPSVWLSGDQKGAEAASVPASGSATSVSSERTQRRVLPSALTATKAICWPSGEIFTGAVAPVVTAPVPAKPHLSGGKRVKRTACAGCGAGRK